VSNAHRRLVASKSSREELYVAASGGEAATRGRASMLSVMLADRISSLSNMIVALTEHASQS